MSAPDVPTPTGKVIKAPAYPYTPSEAELDREYALLLDRAIMSGGPELIGLGQLPEADAARWTREVAEPWWQAMRERAEQDGLRIRCFVGGDSMLFSVGLDVCMPGAQLLGPDGEFSHGWTQSAEQLQALEDAWGETLLAARRRHPYKPEAAS